MVYLIISAQILHQTILDIEIDFCLLILQNYHHCEWFNRHFQVQHNLISLRLNQVWETNSDYNNLNRSKNMFSLQTKVRTNRIHNYSFLNFQKTNKSLKSMILNYLRNMIDFLVATINIQQDRIQRVRQQMQNSGQTFLSQVFQYLYKRFKKTKKTKEQMIKYTMRKSFKFITDQMKKQDPSLIPILSTDGIEGMSIYFTKNSNDKQISIPFKKNSVQKTMNTAFLKSVFSVQQFAKDYKRFLKTFQNQFIKDNKKKINSMSDAVKICINTKNYKSLENYKRIPWTTDILAKLKSFAVDLLNYSPYKGSISEDNSNVNKQKIQKQNTKTNLVSQDNKIKPRKTSFQLNTDYYKQDHEYHSHKRSNSDDHLRQFINDDEDENENDDLIHQLTQQQKKVKKKSVIILTPPMLPLSDPPKLPQEEPLQ